MHTFNASRISPVVGVFIHFIASIQQRCNYYTKAADYRWLFVQFSEIRREKSCSGFDRLQRIHSIHDVMCVLCWLGLCMYCSVTRQLDYSVMARWLGIDTTVMEDFVKDIRFGKAELNTMIKGTCRHAREIK